MAGATGGASAELADSKLNHKKRIAQGQQRDVIKALLKTVDQTS